MSTSTRKRSSSNNLVDPPLTSRASDAFGQIPFPSQHPFPSSSLSPNCNNNSPSSSSSSFFPLSSSSPLSSSQSRHLRTSASSVVRRKSDESLLQGGNKSVSGGGVEPRKKAAARTSTRVPLSHSKSFNSKLDFDLGPVVHLKRSMTKVRSSRERLTTAEKMCSYNGGNSFAVSKWFL